MKVIKTSFSLFALLLVFIFAISPFYTRAEAQFIAQPAQSTPNQEVDPCTVTPGQPTPTPDPLVVATTSASPVIDDTIFSTNPSMECITEALATVEINFHGLTAGGKYVLCTGHSRCLEEDGVDIEDVLGEFVPTKDTLTAGGDGVLSITVCGDGDKKVKTDCDGENWFWGGNMYMVSVGVISNDKHYFPSRIGAFYVSRSYPKITIQPNTNLTINTGALTVALSGNERPGGVKRNNYRILVTGGEGYEGEDCLGLGESRTFPNISRIGTYTINVEEQVNEPSTKNSIGGSLNILNPIPGFVPFIGGGNFLQPRSINVFNTCQGGFTYYTITCTVTNPDKGGGSCTDPGEGKDPFGEEYKAFLADLAALNNEFSGISFPCGDGSLANTTLNPGNCLSINTAIGPIEVTAQGFIRSIFTFVLTIASFGAVVIIIYSGYMFMVSRGDKEKLQGARETITAAIVGLLFIIFSIVILEIIGIDILRIPGFGR